MQQYNNITLFRIFLLTAFKALSSSFVRGMLVGRVIPSLDNKSLSSSVSFSSGNWKNKQKQTFSELVQEAYLMTNFVRNFGVLNFRTFTIFFYILIGSTLNECIHFQVHLSFNEGNLRWMINARTSEQQIILGAFGYLTPSKFSQLGKITLLIFCFE